MVPFIIGLIIASIICVLFILPKKKKKAEEIKKKQPDYKYTYAPLSPQKPQVWKHIIAIVIMLIMACIYFAPALSGDVVYQGDMQKSEAMAHQQRMAADSTGTIPNWSPGMFSGMPGYQIASEPQKSVFSVLKSILILRPLGLERNIGVLWLYLIGFYVALIAMGCNPWLSLLGAVSFGLGSYNIIIIEAGHITKGWAMSMIAPVLAGMVLALRSVERKQDGDGHKSKYKIHYPKLLWGAILFSLAAGLQITLNHLQITYYTLIGGLVIGFVYLAYALKQKWFKQFIAVVAVLLVGAAFAAGANYRHLTINQEYMRYTMRGGNEITASPQDIGIPSTNQSGASKTGGLEIDYAFSWSYGVGETYTILVPGAAGGGSNEKVSDDSQWKQRTGQSVAPLYWGNQPFTSGPVYFGAIVLFLFFLGCFVVKGPEKWWIIICAVISILLSWGRNFMPLNEFLFNHLPLYNKFRTPSMSLVLTNVVMAVMATLSVKAICDAMADISDKTKDKVASYDTTKRLNRAMIIAASIVVGIIAIGIILAISTLSFTGAGDGQIKAMTGDQWPMFERMLVEERRALFLGDSVRSLVFVVLAFGSLWLFVNRKIKKGGIVIAALIVLTVIDLWGVDRRYLNNDNFVSRDDRNVTLRRTATEQMLDNIAAVNGDADYRVFDLTVNTFNDSRPSAFHNEIGGYSAAKMRRYQDLIDFYLGSQKLYDYVNSCRIGVVGSLSDMPLLAVEEPYPVLDMLNARYLMLNLQQNQPTPVRRTSALGPCWLASEVKLVDDVNAEILALNDFNPATTAIVDKSQWGDKVNFDGLLNSAVDSSETITRIHTYPQTPDHLTYSSHTMRDHVAVFSEIYYAPDWRAYIDGKPADYFRANYVLRAIVLPAGDHKIEFINEAPTLHRNDTITLIISIVMLLIIAGSIFIVYKKKNNKEDDRYYFFDNRCSFKLPKEVIIQDNVEKNGLKHTLMTSSMGILILEIRQGMPKFPQNIETKNIRVAGFPCLAAKTNPLMSDYSQYSIDCKEFVVQVDTIVAAEEFLNSFRKK